MSKFLMLVLLVCSFHCFSQEVVWDYKSNEQLSQSYSKFPVMTKRWFRLFEIDKYRLGKPISPYYKIDDSIYRDFQNQNSCYQIKKENTYFFSRKINCSRKPFYIVVNDQRFDHIIDIESLKSFESELFQNIAQKNIEAYHHQAQEILSNLDQIDEYVFSIMSAKVFLKREFLVNKTDVILRSVLSTTRSNYSFLSERSKIKNQDLKIEPQKGDMIFSNGTELFLYKRYQPRPLNFRFLDINESYLSYLENIELYLFKYSNFQRCFRDNLLNQNKHDCDFLIFKKKAFYQWAEFGLIRVKHQQNLEVKIYN